ncbi:MAG: hypothetical protein ABI748_02820 [Dokdonella sp.]
MFRSAPIHAGLIAAGVLALAACSSHKAADADADADAAKAAATAQPPPARQKTVFDDQLKALDKAKAVEKQLQKDKEKQDAEIDAQGG